ncbi:MAG: hypothetical protein J2P49_04365 [Methylocapsa sp.]|nr:hypothetical protein [Methylocapsa sp.]
MTSCRKPLPPDGSQSWDIALMTRETNDFSVCTTWRMSRGDYYLVAIDLVVVSAMRKGGVNQLET